MRDRFEWSLCCISYLIIMAWPWSLLRQPIVNFLPLAGLYANTKDFAEYQEFRTGFCTLAPPKPE